MKELLMKYSRKLKICNKNEEEVMVLTTIIPF